MTKPEQEEQPLYFGHRARLKERFMVDEGASMPDYELLELLLMMAIPRRDVKPLAKTLISEFGSLKNVLHAPAHQLLEKCNLGPNAIVLLRLFHTCMLRSAYLGFTVSEEPVISCWEQFEEYCWNDLAYKEIEEFHVYFFDESLHYKGNKLLSTGTINQAVVHPREVVRAAIENNAVYLVIAHNHPSGAIKPSDFDIAVTREIEALADVMNFELYDHLIVGKDGICSLRNEGIILPKKKRDEGGKLIDNDVGKKNKRKK